MSENGIISLGGSLFNGFPQNLNFLLFTFSTLIAPFWSNVDLNRFGVIFHRIANDSNSLKRAENLTAMLFPGTEVGEVTGVTVITWYRVAEVRFPFGNFSTDDEVEHNYVSYNCKRVQRWIYELLILEITDIAKRAQESLGLLQAMDCVTLLI